MASRRGGRKTVAPTTGAEARARPRRQVRAARLRIQQDAGLFPTSEREHNSQHHDCAYLRKHRNGTAAARRNGDHIKRRHHHHARAQGSLDMHARTAG
jgi:hypothetical protein